MLLICYNVNHRNHPKPIELCGWFNSWQHFKYFLKVEECRGWNLVGEVKLLKS